ncbi:hypothetical protein PR048_000932 [Dryococelus australis]|uniref:Uncharacterized protein n=1 Tax=Dryococelus australis TaxID=614101 RepID=A0ABQ9IGW5_9NEOP|nr:hypothetical protein PR048_000932 [Dryococelus australis]
MLYPKYTKLYPKECGKYYLVGTVHTSPTNILEMSKANYYNNTKYIATWQNCQTWVKELAYKMGGEVAKKIDEFKTLKEANPVVAVVGKKKNAVGLRSFSS